MTANKRASGSYWYDLDLSNANIYEAYTNDIPIYIYFPDRHGLGAVTSALKTYEDEDYKFEFTVSWADTYSSPTQIRADQYFIGTGNSGYAYTYVT